MDQTDAQKYAAIYRLMAEIFERERPARPQERHMSFVLGDLARRVFVGTQFDPPDEIFEAAAEITRTGDAAQREQIVHRLREHAKHLDEWRDDTS